MGIQENIFFKKKGISRKPKLSDEFWKLWLQDFGVCKVVIMTFCRIGAKKSIFRDTIQWKTLFESEFCWKLIVVNFSERKLFKKLIPDKKNFLLDLWISFRT